jgi:periplasmic copper chaperone A
MKWLYAGLACGAMIAHAQAEKNIDVIQPYAYATVPGQPVGGAYFKMVNRGLADRLLKASTPAAGSIQMHATSMRHQVMRMREVAAIDVPQGQTTELKPGAFHLMLMDLKAPLQPGDVFNLVLQFERAGTITTQLKVMPR